MCIKKDVLTNAEVANLTKELNEKCPLAGDLKVDAVRNTQKKVEDMKVETKELKAELEKVKTENANLTIALAKANGEIKNLKSVEQKALSELENCKKDSEKKTESFALELKGVKHLLGSTDGNLNSATKILYNLEGFRLSLGTVTELLKLKIFMTKI